MELTNIVEELIKEFSQPKAPAREGIEYNVSRTVSVLAVIYEKVRNAVEFRAEHLIRRAAIERILKRRILTDNGQAIAETLITELLWARYIDSSLVDKAKVTEVQRIIDRYLVVRQHLPTVNQKVYNVSWNVLLGLVSSEIEEAIVSAAKRGALTNFVYQAVRPKVNLPEVAETSVNLYTYVAVERAFAQADDQLIAFHLLKIVFPEWLSLSSVDTPTNLPRFWKYLEIIQQSLRSSTTDAIFRYVRRQTPPYFLLRDFFFEAEEKVGEYLADEAKLVEKLTDIAERRYKEIGVKVKRAMIRSFIYIFLTKMVFALALEAPYDFYIAQKITYLPLIINTLFPPIMLFFVAGLFSVPRGDNTKRLISRIQKIIYHFPELAKEEGRFTAKEKIRRPVLSAIFSVIYLVTFVITFGLINWVLSLLQFNPVSKIIFVFFVALVSFFAYRIRTSAKEYEMVDRQGILEPVVDFFLLPVIRAGHVLSREIAKLNIFIFLFDFILEAPLKIIFEVVEEWIRFIRRKKEEIV